MKPSPKLKSEIIAITYSAIVKQIFKLSKNNSEANQKLMKLGQQVGVRIADEYNERETNSFKPEEFVTTFIRGILRQYMGCQSFIARNETQFMKTKFIIKFRIIIKENPLSDFIILNRSVTEQNGQSLNYHAIVMGFINGCLKSMNYHPTISIFSDSMVNENVDVSGSFFQKAETVFDVDMWKEKEED